MWQNRRQLHNVIEKGVSMKMRTIKEKIKLSLFIAFCLLGLSFLYLFLNQVYGFSIPCLFHKFTGYYCPGCGITRVMFSLLKFDIVSAFRYNALVICMLPVFFISGGIHYYNWLCQKTVKNFPEWFWYILLVITILFGILRNLEMFSFLQPGGF